ncbi:eukaryotic type KH-domain (KH-domain type I) [Parathielavia appendiculata]|uniref:Eukaryotic type KH-domain (KH-domain type I) n=1 Tax=Parathielavia appendiculata TaxID=2587402 RepID=A0AAN6Z854_9PEZI|nr:eukaryotic type KH-domain (KH-domain type I) [Parathielavia appendiculata]
MSASPQPTHSAKRPLEDTSSPSVAGQPEAKRPALDKVVKDEEEIKEPISAGNAEAAPAASSPPSEANGITKTNGEKSEVKDAQGDTVVPDAPETKPITSTASGDAAQGQSNPPPGAHDETAWIHVRAVISSPEAATIIGKGGENVSKIRQMSGAKCTVSDYQKGAVERILTVSGIVDAVAKAFGLIIRTLNNEPLNEPSNQHSKTYPLRLLVPHILIGSIIGKGGARIKEIQEASGARLNASDSCLPLSTERSLVVMGVADAVHIATYYVGSTLLEQLNERFGGAAASAYATRSGGPAGAVPGGMQVIPYNPQPAGGNYGNRDNYHRGRADPRAHHMPPHSYAPQYGHPVAAHPHAAAPMPYGGHAAAGYGAGPHVPPHPAGAAGPHAPAGPHGPPLAGGAGMPGAPLTQQIYIPNDMVGAIIGKGGQKINEIRQISGSVIKINEPQDNSNERLVTITGTEECNRMALYLLYTRLGKLREQHTNPAQAQHR